MEVGKEMFLCEVLTSDHLSHDETKVLDEKISDGRASPTANHFDLAVKSTP
jgi:hypothetical protein